VSRKELSSPESWLVLLCCLVRSHIEAHLGPIKTPTCPVRDPRGLSARPFFLDPSSPGPGTLPAALSHRHRVLSRGVPESTLRSICLSQDVDTTLSLQSFITPTRSLQTTAALSPFALFPSVCLFALQRSPIPTLSLLGNRQLTLTSPFFYCTYLKYAT
jgi:hypothetical protein